MDINVIRSRFEQHYGDSGDIRVFFSPLRVNLIGEYTDVAGGHVLPCALEMGIYAAARKRDDNTIRFKSADEQKEVSVDISRELSFVKDDGWANYPKGVVKEIIALGKPIKGADIFYVADTAGLTASGLSSSAALEVLTGVIFNGLYELEIDGVKMSLLSQRAENYFVGVMCGIMDQFAVMMGKKSNALLLNCGTLEYKYIPFELEKNGLKLVIMNTNKKRGLLDSKYNERRSELERALEELRAAGDVPEGGNLLSVKPERAEAVFGENAALHMLRAKHIYFEDARVREASRALADNDFVTFGKLLEQSHMSLKYDFDVTGLELDALQEAASAEDGCIGARMTGAGFGGCALAIVRENSVDGFIDEVSKKYTEKTGLTAGFHVCGAASGAREII